MLVHVGPLLGVIFGGAIALLTAWLAGRHQLESTREQIKTEYMAEKTAHYLLSHAAYTDRSFDTLKQHLGGFEENELRKILVRAGGKITYASCNLNLTHDSCSVCPRNALGGFFK